MYILNKDLMLFLRETFRIALYLQKNYEDSTGSFYMLHT